MDAEELNEIATIVADVCREQDYYLPLSLRYEIARRVLGLPATPSSTADEGLYEGVARFLFDRLDDIDTLDDAALDDADFRRGARRIHRRRFEVASTDGYTVYFSPVPQREPIEEQEAPAPCGYYYDGHEGAFRGPCPHSRAQHPMQSHEYQPAAPEPVSTLPDPYAVYDASVYMTTQATSATPPRPCPMGCGRADHGSSICATPAPSVPVEEGWKRMFEQELTTYGAGTGAYWSRSAPSIGWFVPLDLESAIREEALRERIWRATGEGVELIRCENCHAVEVRAEAAEAREHDLLNEIAEKRDRIQRAREVLGASESEPQASAAELP